MINMEAIDKIFEEAEVSNKLCECYFIVKKLRINKQKDQVSAQKQYEADDDHLNSIMLKIDLMLLNLI